MPIEDLNYLWKKMSRKTAARLLVVAILDYIRFRSKLFEEVSVSKVPRLIPVGWAKKYRIDVVALQSQRPDASKPFHTFGYEIKSCRADFLSDKKWKDYLGRTDIFNFVAPPGAIKPEELEPKVGLIEVHLISYNIRWDREERGFGARPRHKVGTGFFEVSDIARYDTMYGLATANARATEGYRGKLHTEEAELIQKALEEE